MVNASAAFDALAHGESRGVKRQAEGLTVV
jgi:hypothetical protein